jgi:hypothetical protein
MEIATPNGQFGAINVHPVRPDTMNLSPGVAGLFDRETWTMFLQRKLVNAEMISKQDARELAGTVYHEARHAEQHFRIAQMLASSMSSDAIQAKLKIPKEVADAAMRHKGNPDMDREQVKAFAEDKYGSNASRHREVNTQVRARLIQYSKVRARYDVTMANPDASALEIADAHTELMKMQSSVTIAYGLYRDLAIEADSAQIEEKAKALYPTE